MYDDHTFLAAERPDAVVELEALESSLAPIAAPPVAPANHGFQFPRRLWLAMFTCYAIFFGFIASGTSRTRSMTSRPSARSAWATRT